MNQSTSTKPSNQQIPKVVKSNELPLSCPTADSKTWNLHPKVYLEFNELGKASCQYCGAQYVLQEK